MWKWLLKNYLNWSGKNKILMIMKMLFNLKIKNKFYLNPVKLKKKNNVVEILLYINISIFYNLF